LAATRGARGGASPRSSLVNGRKRTCNCPQDPATIKKNLKSQKGHNLRFLRPSPPIKLAFPASLKDQQKKKWKYWFQVSLHTFFTQVHARSCVLRRRLAAVVLLAPGITFNTRAAPRTPKYPVLVRSTARSHRYTSLHIPCILNLAPSHSGPVLSLSSRLSSSMSQTTRLLARHWGTEAADLRIRESDTRRHRDYYSLRSIQSVMTGSWLQALFNSAEFM
jgi:hypothetical protein